MELEVVLEEGDLIGTEVEDGPVRIGKVTKILGNGKVRVDNQIVMGAQSSYFFFGIVQITANFEKIVAIPKVSEVEPHGNIRITKLNLTEFDRPNMRWSGRSLTRR